MDANRMLIKPSHSFLLAAALAVISAPLQAAEPGHTATYSFSSSKLPSFTAEQILSFPESDQIIDRSRLEFSEKGMRIIRGSGNNRQILLRDHVTNQTWLIDPRRSIQHEIRYRNTAVGPSSDTKLQPMTEPDRAPTVSPEPLQSGLLSPLPCMNYPRLQRLNVERWRGQAISAWSCLDHLGNIVGTDYFSDSWKMVVRSELIGILIEELRAITALSFPDGHFHVDTEHVSVSLDELMHGSNLVSRKYE